MRFDVINPAAMLPAQPTDSGAPLLGKTPFDLATIVPMPNLPDDGSKPEDKHSKNEQALRELEESEDELPDIFQLIMPPDFKELFKFYFFLYDSDTWQLQKKWRQMLGVQEFDPIPYAMKKASHVHLAREERYETTMFHHYTKPGKRFTGAM